MDQEAKGADALGLVTKVLSYSWILWLAAFLALRHLVGKRTVVFIGLFPWTESQLRTLLDTLKMRCLRQVNWENVWAPPEIILQLFRKSQWKAVCRERCQGNPRRLRETSCHLLWSWGSSFSLSLSLRLSLSHTQACALPIGVAVSGLLSLGSTITSFS